MRVSQRSAPFVAAILLHIAECQRSLFVQRRGQQFVLLGQNFTFGGTNNYYLPFKPKPQIEDVFLNAKDMGVRVIRTWAFNLIGNPERKDEKGLENWPHSVQDYIGDYMSYWDTETWTSKFNEGPNGLLRLDYVIKRAKDLNIKLILALTNNWSAYGGAEQINLFYGLKHHDYFFTDFKAKFEYKKWVQYLLNRNNTLTGMAYKDEPTIFAWELMNEPRCEGCQDIGGCSNCATCRTRSSTCTHEVITEWVNEMAKFIRSIDRRHLIGVGDDGFLSGGNEWAFDGKDGDHEALAKIPEIDFLTFHMYPNAWGKDADWAKKWIEAHIDIAKKYNKPFILEEFGHREETDQSKSPEAAQEIRNQLYDEWTQQMCKAGGNWLFWMIAGREAYSDTDILDGKPLYPDYDKYTVYFRTADGKITPSGQRMKDRIARSNSGTSNSC